MSSSRDDRGLAATPTETAWFSGQSRRQRRPRLDTSREPTRRQRPTPPWWQRLIEELD